MAEIMALKPKYQEVVLLHYYQQLRVNEIAGGTGGAPVDREHPASPCTRSAAKNVWKEGRMKICDETVRAAVDSGLGGIQLDAAQKRAQCRPTVAVAPPRRAARPLRRVLAVAAAFAVAFSIGGGVLAAAPELRQSLSILGAETLQQLQPINQVSEDQGIRMEVLAAVNDGQVAVVFLSLQDTAGQGRVEPTSQLYDSEISGANFTRGEVVDYDAATGTTVLRLVADASESMAGKKITVSSKSILSGEDRHSPTYSGYTVASLRAATGDAAIQYPQNLAGSMVGGRRWTGSAGFWKAARCPR